MTEDRGTKEARATLWDYHAWALKKLRDGGYPNESHALNYVFLRWLDRDREEARAEFGISREAFTLETQGATVKSIRSKASGDGD